MTMIYMKVSIRHSEEFAFGMMISDAMTGETIPEIAVDDLFEKARGAREGDTLQLTQYLLNKEGKPYIDEETQEVARITIPCYVTQVLR